VAVATVLFVGGMAFAYYVVLPAAIPFLINFDQDVFNNQVRAKDYISFASLTILAVGLLFELPIFILGLVRLKVLTAS
jgi:sec-independent protein translocase protein TatC